MEEMEGDVSDHRELRRRMQLAEERASGLQKKADRCELAEAKLRAAEANAQNLQEERSQAHKRLQEMTEKLLHVTNEKDVLVRHSAHQVHVEAELANAKRELEQARRSGLAVRAERKEHAVEWNEAAENMGRVLRHHIYSHTRWEKDAGGEVAGAAEAHAHGQRSAVRLVAAAEAEAASLAGEAVDVVRTTRQLLREHAAECAAVIEEIGRVHAQRGRAHRRGAVHAEGGGGTRGKGGIGRGAIARGVEASEGGGGARGGFALGARRSARATRWGFDGRRRRRSWRYRTFIIRMMPIRMPTRA